MKPFSISIPEPCSEIWEQMTPCERGRFCGSCQKTVIDFTDWSDTALYEFFSQEVNQNVCGRIHMHQIENKIFSYVAPVKRPALTLAMAASVAALTVISATVANAQASRNVSLAKKAEAPIHVTKYQPDTSKPKVHDRKILTEDDIIKYSQNIRQGLFQVANTAGILHNSRDSNKIAPIKKEVLQSIADWLKKHF